MNPPPLTSDFSLVLGGPLYQVWRGTRLADDALHLLHRRVLVAVLLASVPLLLLSIAEWHAWATASARHPRRGAVPGRHYNWKSRRCPVVPLTLTLFSLQEPLERLLKLVF